MDEQRRKFNRMMQAAASGRLSRREFMGFAVASGITAATASTLFSTVARAEPKRGGTFKLGMPYGASTDSLDPATYNHYLHTVGFWGSLSNGLTEIDSDGNIVGDLAESFEPADGNQKWVVKLRKGVAFHDGRTLTVDDVVASIDYHRGEDSRSVVKDLLGAIVNVKADGPETVIFELEAANADFPYLLSDYHLPIMPSNDGRPDWESGVRTGPYVLDRFEPGVSVSMNRNPNYFKSDRAWFDRVEIYTLMDVTTRSNALLTGEIDYMDRCDLKSLDLLASNPGIVIQETPGTGHAIFAMDTTAKPFDDNNVRLAMKHSIDREEVREKIFQGRGVVGNDNPIASTVKYAVDPEPRHGYDPEKAKEYLAKAGLERLSVDLSVANTGWEGSPDAALLWQQQAKACNIDINIIREPEDGYWENVWLKKPLMATQWGGRPTVDWMMTLAYSSDSDWNETKWKNERFDELLVSARSEGDEAKRGEMYAEMQQLLHDDGGALIVNFFAYVDAHAKNLGHGKVGGNLLLDGGKIAERWWFTD